MCVCMSNILSEGKTCSDLGRVLDLNDPPVRFEGGVTATTLSGGTRTKRTQPADWTMQCAGSGDSCRYTSYRVLDFGILEAWLI